MEDKIRKWIVDIIGDNEELLKVAIKQRAKFEGWLKFMLVKYALDNNCEDVRVEENYGKNKRADLSFKSGESKYYIELKTANANWKIEGVEKRTRPVTKNIASIINDARKLKEAKVNGVVAFVFFPIPENDTRWKYHIKRIENEVDVDLLSDGHYSKVTINNCEILVFSFSV